MQDLWQDIRYGARMLLKAPNVTLIAVLTLGLGIGANTAIFSLIDAVLLRELPYRDPGRLVVLWASNPRFLSGALEVPPTNADVAAWRERTQSFAQVAAFTPQIADLAEQGDPERVGGVAVTPDFFQAIGVEPFIGRTFTPEESRPAAAGVGLISHGLWQRRFGSDPKLVGKEIVVNGNKLTVIGVLPPEFDFPRGAELPALLPFAPRTDIWTLIKWDAQRWQSHFNRGLVVLARLKPGVSLDQAQAEMSAYASRMAMEFPDSRAGWVVNVTPLHKQVAGKSQTALLILFASVGLLLLIACVNIANLLLARGVARRHELAVRAALGAGRSRVIRQLLTESVLLSLLGGGLGMLVAAWLNGLVLSFSAANLPRPENVSLNAMVFAFTALVSLVAGVVFGLIPAYQMSKINLRDAINEGGRGTESPVSNKLRDWLIAAEVALAVVLLAGAGLLAQSFLRAQAIDPGFKAASVLAFDVSLPNSRYADDSRQVAFFQQLLTRFEAMPGVRAA